MTQPERRSASRHLLEIPVRFRCFEIGCTDLEIPAQAMNVSHSGLFIISSQKLNVGTVLSLNMRVPTEISGSVFSELRCTGRVVHRQDLPDGKIGYGIEIEQTAPPLGPTLADNSHSSRDTLTTRTGHL